MLMSAGKRQFVRGGKDERGCARLRFSWPG
jgi:hypothetical protein